MITRDKLTMSLVEVIEMLSLPILPLYVLKYGEDVIQMKLKACENDFIFYKEIM